MPKSHDQSHFALGMIHAAEISPMETGRLIAIGRLSPTILFIFILLLFGTSCQKGGHPLSLDEPSSPNQPDFPPPDGADTPYGSIPPGQLHEIKLQVTSQETTLARIWGTLSNHRSRFGVIFVSGINGGFEQPGDLIYERFGQELGRSGVASIFVSFRYAGEMSASIQDVHAAANHLKHRGVARIALVGWSFGGAVAIQSAVQIPEVTTVTTFAGQSIETEPVERFTRQSLLVIHSKNDENVPYYAAEQIFESAPSTIHKEFLSLENFNHLFDQASSLLDPVFRNWISTELIQHHHG